MLVRLVMCSVSGDRVWDVGIFQFGLFLGSERQFQRGDGVLEVGRLARADNRRTDHAVGAVVEREVEALGCQNNEGILFAADPGSVARGRPLVTVVAGATSSSLVLLFIPVVHEFRQPGECLPGCRGQQSMGSHVWGSGCQLRLAHRSQATVWAAAPRESPD